MEAWAQATPEEILKAALADAGLTPIPPDPPNRLAPSLDGGDNLGERLSDFAKRIRAAAGGVTSARAVYPDGIQVFWELEGTSKPAKGEILIQTGAPFGFVFASAKTDKASIYAIADPSSGKDAQAFALEDRKGRESKPLTVAVAGSGAAGGPQKGGKATSASAGDSEAYGGDSEGNNDGGVASATSHGNGSTKALGGRGGPDGGAGAEATAKSQGKGRAKATGGAARGGKGKGGDGIAISTKGDAEARGGNGAPGSVIQEGGPGGTGRANGDRDATAFGGMGGSGAKGGEGGKASAHAGKIANATGGPGGFGFFEGGAGGCARAFGTEASANATGGPGAPGSIRGGAGGNAVAESEKANANAFGGAGGAGGPAPNGNGGRGGHAGILSDHRGSAVGGVGGPDFAFFGTGGKGGNVMVGSFDPKAKAKKLVPEPGGAGGGFFPGGPGVQEDLVRPIPYCPF